MGGEDYVFADAREQGLEFGGGKVGEFGNGTWV